MVVLLVLYINNHFLQEPSYYSKVESTSKASSTSFSIVYHFKH
jgi:hypothetical protein